MPKRKVRERDFWAHSPKNVGKIVQQAEWVFLQARTVRESARFLIADIGRLESLVADLRKAADEGEEEPRPRPVEPQLRREAPRILRLSDVVNRIGLCRSTIYRLQQEGQFPRQVQLGARSVGWHSEDVDAWLSSRKHTRTDS
jgi:prophage regulatory protein